MASSGGFFRLPQSCSCEIVKSCSFRRDFKRKKKNLHVCSYLENVNKFVG